MSDLLTPAKRLREYSDLFGVKTQHDQDIRAVLDALAASETARVAAEADRDRAVAERDEWKRNAEMLRDAVQIQQRTESAASRLVDAHRGEQKPGRWRVGTKLGRTLYMDDRCIGMVDTPEIAAVIVGGLNAQSPSPSAPDYMGKPASLWYEKARAYGALAARFIGLLGHTAHDELSQPELDEFDRRVLDAPSPSARAEEPVAYRYKPNGAKCWYYGERPGALADIVEPLYTAPPDLTAELAEARRERDENIAERIANTEHYHAEIAKLKSEVDGAKTCADLDRQREERQREHIAALHAEIARLKAERDESAERDAAFDAAEAYLTQEEIDRMSVAGIIDTLGCNLAAARAEIAKLKERERALSVDGSEYQQEAETLREEIAKLKVQLDIKSTSYDGALSAVAWWVAEGKRMVEEIARLKAERDEAWSTCTDLRVTIATYSAQVATTTGYVLKDKADGTYAMSEDDAWTPHRSAALRFSNRNDAVEELARGEYVHSVRIVRLVKPKPAGQR